MLFRSHDGLFLGHAPNYAEVLAKGEDLHGQIRQVRILSTDGEVLFGQIGGIMP